MQEMFENHIQTTFPFLNGKKLLLAVSGGIDSMVLMQLLQKQKIAVAHCNFGLRGAESDEDVIFVKRESDKRNIPFYSKKFDTFAFAQKNKLSIQVAARELRYQWFYVILRKEKYDYILTAHHLDDVLETFLIHFCRGTGLDGLTGIPAINNQIIRPLLPFSREKIENFATENNILWREDSSNQKEKYLRNKIRHQVVPVFKELNTSFLESFSETLKYLQDAQKLVEDASNSVYKQVVITKEDQLHIDIEKLEQQSNYKQYLYQWLKKYGFTAWQDVYRLVTANTGKKTISKTHTLLKNREFLVLSENQKNGLDEVFYIQEGQLKVNFPIKLELFEEEKHQFSDNNCIFVDAEKLNFPLSIRKRKAGDVFFPEGMQGKKKISKYYKDQKYSIFDKEKQWLLCSNNQIVWVIGKRADQRFLADNETKRIIKIELKE